MPLVVIVDDLRTNRAIFTQLAKSIGDDVVVECFARPTEALAWLATNTPDLIVVDYKLPEFSGAEFIRRFRSLEGRGEIPIIVITAYDDRSYRLRALDAGATDFIQSPPDPPEFQVRVRNLLALSMHQKAAIRESVRLAARLDESERSHERQLRDSHERLVQVIDVVPVMISAEDLAGNCIFVNAYKAAIAGLDLEQAHMFDEVAVFGQAHRAHHQALARALIEGGAPLPRFEERIERPDLPPLTFLTAKSALRDSAGRLIGLLTTSLDISERKAAEERLAYLACHDHLTGLPNRAYLHDQLASLQSGDDAPDRTLFFLDLDRFKDVNDWLGHGAGDALLRDIATRLSPLIEPDGFIARLGGDEFAIVQPTDPSPANTESTGEHPGIPRACAFAALVMGAFATPYEVAGKQVTVDVSVGIAFQSSTGPLASDTECVAAWLRNADLAMYRSKSAAGSALTFFHPDMLRETQGALQLQSELREALDRNELFLLFQPQIDAKSRQIVGAEALLRWRHPVAGIVMPETFLPIAEASGLMSDITAWVIRTACAEAAIWQGAFRRALRVAVNVSPGNVQRDDLARMAGEAILAAGLLPSHLELELSEAILVSQVDAAAKDLRALRRSGVQLAIDDFGTGQSSLMHLKRFEVDRLKIDRSFIRHLETSEVSDIAIVRAVIGLAHALGIQVVAEGVETEAQATRLTQEGCDTLQGFHFGVPMSSEAFIAWGMR